MASSSSTVGTALPWEGSSKGRDDALHLAIAWSLDEPARVGEVALVQGKGVLGRGGPQPEDRASRLIFRRARPGETGPTRPLESQRVSRVQLRLSLEGDAIRIENVGKTPLTVRDREVRELTVGEGDVFALKNAMVVVVVRRPKQLPELRAFPHRTFRFGGADPLGIVGESAQMWALRDAVAIAAKSPHHVLVRGESGVGKELAARALHQLSSRASGPMIARNAATLPEGLVDAELFGNVRNYPNAGSPERPGLLGEADGGTLVLDEIGELPASLQAHLLRALDRGGEYQRLGESKPRTSDFRLVAMTNRPLDALKHDFAARFAARVDVPGLGDRIEDIPLLARHLVLEMSRSAPDVASRFLENGEIPRIDPRLVEALLRHRFTLHLRELQRLLWTAIAESKGEFVELVPAVATELEAPAKIRAAEPPMRLGEAEVRAALEKNDGNVTHAARALGLESRYVLYRLMKRFGIERPSPSRG